MAIKEFSSGPQNYFEPGYFNGDYTEPNVSRSFLECDVDNIRGGRFVTGEYYLGNYIDGSYYHDNSIRTTLVCDALVVQEAEIGLGGYYQDGYLTIGYFTPTTGGAFSLICVTGVDHFGEAAISAVGTMSITAIKILQFESTLTVIVNQTATISHIEGADLFAFSNAQLEAAVRRIRNNNITAGAAFSVATDVERIQQADSDVDSIFSAIINGLRSRDVNLTTQAAFSFVAEIQGTKTFEITAVNSFVVSITATKNVDISKSISAQSDIVANTQRLRDTNIDLVSTSTLGCLGNNQRGYDIVASDFATVVITAVITKNVGAVFSATVSQSATANYQLGQLSLNAVVLAQINANSTISVRNTQVSQFNAVSIDTGTKQFGLGSAKFTNVFNSSDALIQNNLSNILHDGTNFKIFTDQYTWTSSDGLSWTRESSSLGSSGRVRFANSRYFTHSGSNARYSTNGTTWANEAITNGSGGTLEIVFLNSNFHNIYLTTVSNTRRFRTNKTSAFGSANWITDQEIANTGRTFAQGTTFTPIVNINNFAVWSYQSVSSNTIVRYNGTTVNQYQAPTGGLPDYIGYNGSNESIYQSTTVVKYSTNTFVSFDDLDIGAGNRLTGNAVYVNGRWFVPTKLGLYSGTTVTALSLADVNTKTQVAFGGGRYIAQENYFQNFADAYGTGSIRHSTDASTWQSLVVPQQDNLLPRLTYSRTGTDLVNFQTIDFWSYNRFQVAIRESSNRYLMFYAGGSSSLQALVLDGTNAITSSFLNEVGVVPQNQFNHIRISKDGTNIALYINGTRKMQFTSNITSLTGGTVELLGNVETINSFYDEFRVIDELLVNPNTSSFTVPTQRFSNTTNTDLLLHFDTDFGDDSRVNVDPQAAISSVATMQSILSGPVKASATLVVSSNVNVLGGNLQGADLVAFSDAAVTTVGQRTRFGQSQINVESNVIVLVNVIRQTNVAVAVSSSTTISATASLSGTSNISTTAAVSSSANRLRDNNIVLNTSAQVDSIAVKNVSSSSAITSVATVSATATRIFALDATFAAIATSLSAVVRIAVFFVNCETNVVLVASAVKNANGTAGISAISQLAVSITRLRDTEIALVSSSVQSVSANRLLQSSVTINAETNTSTAVLVQRNFDSSLSTSASITALGDLFVGLASIIQVTATQTASATKQVSAIGTLTSACTVVCVAVRTRNTTAQLISQCDVVCLVAGIFSINIVVANFATVIVAGTKAIEMSAALASSTTQIAQGQRIRGLASAVSSVFVSTATAIRQQQGQGSFVSSHSVVGQVNKQASGSTTISSTSAITCVISHIEGADVVVFNFATVSCNAIKVKQFSIALTANSVIISNAEVFVVGAAVLSVSTQTQCQEQIFKGTSVGLTVSCSVVGIARKQVSAVINVVAAGAQIVIGREIRLDNIVYVVPGETAIYKIVAESRLHTIYGESRIHIL